MSITSLKTSLLVTALAFVTAACSPTDHQSNVVETADTNSYNFSNGKSEQRSFTKFSAPKPAYMTNKELVRMFADRTAYGKHNDTSGEWVEFTSKDGRALFLNKNGEIANGEWWVKNDQVCFAYNSYSSTSCNHVEKKGSDYQFVQSNGTKEFYITDIKRGDAADLASRYLIRQ